MAVKHHEAAVLQYTHTHTYTHTAASLVVDVKTKAEIRLLLHATSNRIPTVSPTETAIITRGDITGDNRTQKHHQCNCLLAHR